MKDQEKVIPEGMVEIADGSIIDKADMCTRLAPHPKNPNLLYDRAGVCYVVSNNGGLRRYPPKVKGKKKQKRRMREEEERESKKIL